MEDKLTMIRIKLEDRKYINDISLELGIVQTDVITMIIEAYKKSLNWSIYFRLKREKWKQ